MEVVACVPFENMPDLLRLRIIGTTINYILLEEYKGAGFITQESIEELFKEYTGIHINDAFQLINTTFNDFIAEHFSTMFKNCYPHGLARLSVVDKPVLNFDNFGVQATAAVAPPPAMKAIENASSDQPTKPAAPVIKDEDKSKEQSQVLSPAPVIQEERTNSCQSPFTSSSQSYTTPVESDTELNNAESGNAVTDDHDMISTPVATDAPSTTSVFDSLDEIQNVDDIPDLEEDVLGLVSKSAKEQEKEEQKNEKDADIKSEGDKHTATVDPKLLESSDDDDDDDEEETLVVKEKEAVKGKENIAAKEKPSKSFLETHLLLSDGEDKSEAVSKKSESNAKQSDLAKDNTVQKSVSEKIGKEAKLPSAAKIVKESKPPSAETNVDLLEEDLLSLGSGDEEAVETEPAIAIKEPAKKPTTPSIVKEPSKESSAPSVIKETPKKPTTSPVVKETSAQKSGSAALLQRTLLASSESEEEEKKAKAEPVVELKKKTPSKKNEDIKKPVPVVKPDITKPNNRLLGAKLLSSDEECSDDDNSDGKKVFPNQANSKVKKSIPSSLNRNVLDPSSSDEGEEKSTAVPKLPANHLEDDETPENSSDEASTSNKKGKSNSNGPIKNLHLLNEKFIRPSDSESESEQFVSIDEPKNQEVKEEKPENKNEVYHMNNKKILESDEDEEEQKTSDESEEAESSDEEGPSSLEASDAEDVKKQPAYLEEDLFDILDNQVAESFSKKSVEDDSKAKADEAKKNEENLQKLVKKKEEHEKQGPTASGVQRLEDYMDNVINDSEPAEIIEQPPSKVALKPVEIKKSEAKSLEKVEQKSKPVEIKKENSPLKEIKKSESSKLNESKTMEKVEPEKSKETSYIGKFDPNIPVAGQEFLDQITCSEEIVVVKKAASTVDDDLLNLLETSNYNAYSEKSIPVSTERKPVPLLGDDVLNLLDGSYDDVTSKKSIPVDDNILNDVKVPEKSVEVVNDDFLNEVKVPEKSVQMAGDDFLDAVNVPENRSSVQQSVPFVDDNFLDGIEAPEKSITVVEDDFLNEIGAPQKPIQMAGDDFLDGIGTSETKIQVAGDDFLDSLNVSDNRSSVRKSPKLVDDNFLEGIGAPEKPIQMAGDDFLDGIGAPEKSVEVVNDDFLNEVKVPEKSVQMAGDDFLDAVNVPGNRSSVQKSPQLVDDDFLEGIGATKKSPQLVDDDFLDGIGAPEKSVEVVNDDFLNEVKVPEKSVQMAGDDFLDAVNVPGNRSSVQKSPQLVDDDFLKNVKTSQPAAQNLVPIVEDNFLDGIGAPETKIQVAGDDFLDSLNVSDNRSSVRKSPKLVDDDFLDEVKIPEKPIQMAGDDFLDAVNVPENRSSVQQSVLVVGDDFLSDIKASDSVSAGKKAFPVLDDEFLAQIGRSNDTVKNSKTSSMSSKFSESKQNSSNDANSVPGQHPFKPVISHRPTNLPFFQANIVENLIQVAEIGPDYDSDSSEPSAFRTSNDTFTPVEYKVDRFYNIPNYNNVYEMKKKIADSMPKPKVNFLLNFWLENFSGFPDLVVFFQYLYYHVEQFNLEESLTFKTYHNLVDAIIRREQVFKLIENLVPNIPLMCQYKFLIYDDNYPEFIYVNPELLELQMYPLATGLPTSVMHLFNRKRQWLISDLKKEFSGCKVPDEEFCRQLINFVNDRPDLVMLETSRPKATLPEMTIALNDHVSLKLCCYMFTLADLHVAEKLHLRDDYINSMKQFIPQRPR